MHDVQTEDAHAHQHGFVRFRYLRHILNYCQLYQYHLWHAYVCVCMFELLLLTDLVSV